MLPMGRTAVGVLRHSRFVAGSITVRSLTMVVQHQAAQRRCTTTTTTTTSPPKDDAASAAGSSSASASAAAVTEEAKPLWDDCDTVEDIMDEEKFGSRADSEREQRIAEYKRRIADAERKAALAAAGCDVPEGEAASVNAATAASGSSAGAPGDEEAADAAAAAEDEGPIPELSDEDKATMARQAEEAAAAARVAKEMEGQLPFHIPEDLSPEDHHAIARRALWMGTMLAFAIMGACVAVGMLAMGFSSPGQMLAYVGTKDKRQIAALKENGEDVIVLNLDLTDPAGMAEQMRAVVDVVQQQAQEAAEDEEERRAVADLVAAVRGEEEEDSANQSTA